MQAASEDELSQHARQAIRPTASRSGLPAHPKPIRVAGEGLAADYAAGLLESLGLRAERVPGRRETSRDTDRDWAQSGAMSLTGLPDAPPLASPAAIASCMRGASQALSLLSGALPESTLGSLDGPALLGEHAALAQPKPLERRGPIAPGGTCRLLACADGWLALNLARPDDFRLLPAWLEANVRGDVWHCVSAAVATRARDVLVDRARLMGLPAAPLRAAGEQTGSPWCRIAAQGPARTTPRRAPLVVDLSSLWAGPLCGQLLAAGGAQVLKLESFQRPDGARRGPAAFFDLMNGGKASLAVDLESDVGLRRLRALLERADIVIESNRPRAIRQLGIDPAALVRSRPGRTWLSITGYGQGQPEASWVAFGDDAAAAAGLTATTDCGTPVFCADAIADPLTGLHAAVAALASWQSGGGRLLDVSLHNVAARVAAVTAANPGRPTARAQPPRARTALKAAAPLGRDTDPALAALGIRC